MKKCLKAVSLFLVLFIFIGLLGCTQVADRKEPAPAKQQSTPPAETAKPAEADPKSQITYEGKPTGTLPLTDKPITLTYWVPFNADNAKIMDSFSEVPSWQEIQKLTGITLKFIHPAIKQEKEAFQLLIASGDLPDIVEMQGLKADLYPGGPDQAIKDGTFIRLNELVDLYAPNFKGIMKFKPEIERGMKTDTGNLYAFQMIEKTVQPTYGGPVVRKDWLDDLNLAIPETMDDWYDMLKAFKEKKGATAPMLIEKTGGTDGYYTFLGTYGVIHTFSRIGDKVIFGPIEPGFKEYLAVFNKWYKDGLIDQDFLSHDGCTGANVLKKISSGQAGAWECGFHHFTKIEDAALTEDPNFKIIGVPHPVVKKGDTIKLRQFNEHVRGCPAFITSACKYPVEAVKFMDFSYSDQGTMLYNYGIEGVHYNLVDGKAVFTKAATNHPAFPNAIKVSIFARHEGAYIRDYARTFVSYRQNALDAMNLVWKGDFSNMMPKTLTMTAEEGTTYANIMGDIETLVLEMMPRFIMGVEPMDNFDQFVEKIKKMKIEEAIKIKQASLERFNAR